MKALHVWVGDEVEMVREEENVIIFINCNWVVTEWQWLFYMYTEYEIGY